MAQKEPQLDIPCPRCGRKAKMVPDLDLKASSNVTVLDCPGKGCDHRFAKAQSVKLSGSLVLEAALAMDLQGGYSSLGEFVREAVRGRAQHIQQASAMEGLGVFMGALAEDPETWKGILSGIDDPLYEEEDDS